MRLICTPWAGCDAYLLLPTSIELPSQVIQITPHAVEKSILVSPQQTKTVEIKTEG